MNNLKKYRYPGVQPFSTEESDIFFGRDDEIAMLYRLMMLEKIVILFGKSGCGKSSLLNAGFIPLIQNKSTSNHPHYLPILMRIGKIEGQNVSPIQIVISKIDEQLADLPEWSILDQFDKLPELWLKFKKKQSKENHKFILIFDQFEEFFSYSLPEQAMFKWELANLLFSEVPQSIREKVDEISDEVYSKISSNLDIKVIFTIRSDRLSLLHSMKDAFPNILQNRYEINALTVDQAKKAIILPAQIEDNKFVTHPFTYDDNSLDIIIKELSSIYENITERIETFHLQIICEACESKIEEKLKANIIDIEINKEDLPEFRNLYQQYYKRQIEKLPLNYRHKAQKVLENGLIYEDKKTGNFRRLSVDGNILKKEFEKLKLPDDFFDLLETSFLVRREPNTVGGYSYEIAHETIINPILQVKKHREFFYLKKKPINIVLALILITIILYNIYPYIYFICITPLNQQNKPVVRLEKKLDKITEGLRENIINNAENIGDTMEIDSWTASQLMTGLLNDTHDGIISNYVKLTNTSIVDNLCCCWVEKTNQRDLRASGWIVSTIGTLGLTNSYRCNVLNFFLESQLNDGSWSMVPIDKSLTKYGSTYATCHVLRALHNSLNNISDNELKAKINYSINRGRNWLLNNMQDSVSVIWDDYPKDKKFAAVSSKSLSGLAIHTLNLTGFVPPTLNKRWLKSLKKPDSNVKIYTRESSYMLYQLGTRGAPYHDLTRHLIIPWQIIATIDAYKDGNTFERLESNLWLDHIISNIDTTEVNDKEAYITSEVFIALRYLQDENYSFK